MFDREAAIQDINERNRIRREARLPTLSVDDELRETEANARQQDFEEFWRTSPLRERVRAKIIARYRRCFGNPDWQPSGILSGYGLMVHARTREVVYRLWDRCHRPTT
jgi:hypothetical protein